jgi:hypothetical protein
MDVFSMGLKHRAYLKVCEHCMKLSYIYLTSEFNIVLNSFGEKGSFYESIVDNMVPNGRITGE